MWGAQESPCLATHSGQHNAALVPHSERGGALKAESLAPASWPCDLGQAECDLSVAHLGHHYYGTLLTEVTQRAEKIFRIYKYALPKVTVRLRNV